MMTPPVSTSLRSSAGPGVTESARSSRSLPDRAGASFAALGAALALTTTASAQFPEGYTLGPVTQLGAAKLDLDQIAPGFDLTRECLPLNLDKEKMTTPLDQSAFVLYRLQGESGQTNTLVSVQYWAHDPVPSRNGLEMPLLYRGPEDMTNAPAGEPASLGRHILMNPFFNPDFKTNYVFTSKPVTEVYPERAGDAEFMAKFGDFRLCRYDFTPGAVIGEEFYFRPINVLTATQGNSMTKVPACVGTDAPGITTYYSQRLVDDTGTPYRVAFPLTEAWKPSNFSGAALSMPISFEMAPLVPETVVIPPPPPLATARVDREQVALRWVSDGRPVRLRSSARLGAAAAWADVLDAPTNGPAGVTLTFTHEIPQGDHGSRFFRLDR